MRTFTFQEGSSWLHQRNPTAKLVLHLILSLLLTTLFDPFTPLFFLFGAVLAGKLLGQIPVRVMARSLLPIWILGASLIVSNALFVNNADNARVVWEWGPVTATVEGALFGVSLAERTIAIAALTLLVMMTTEPERLVRSLVQQARMPARFAYSVLAAYRFLPLLSDEWETIRLAQSVRDGDARGGMVDRFRRQGRMIVPLFANAIRRADRIALAMDSRGFNRRGERTQYRHLSLGGQDLLMILTGSAIGGLIILVSAAIGSLSIGTGLYGM